MDFIHEDPTAEREYIKRLMKHKHLNSMKYSIQIKILKNMVYKIQDN